MLSVSESKPITRKLKNKLFKLVLRECGFQKRPKITSYNCNYHLTEKINFSDPSKRQTFQQKLSIAEIGVLKIQTGSFRI